MNVEAFRNEARCLGRPYIFSDLSYGGLEWPEWYKLSNMTKNIEYGCHFGRYWRNNSKDEHITCAKQREHGHVKDSCCCSSCYTNVGYLKFLQNDSKIIKRIAVLFQAKVGFWRKNKGCVLPRKYRSAVCLGYRCVSAEKHIIYGAKGMLVLFMNSIRMRKLSDKNIRILGRALLKSI